MTVYGLNDSRLALNEIEMRFLGSEMTLWRRERGGESGRMGEREKRRVGDGREERRERGAKSEEQLQN